MEVQVLQNILRANDAIAADNRKRFDEHGVYVIDLMSSPGAGKTTLLERTAKALEGEIRLGVIKTPMTEVVTAKYDKLIAEGLTRAGAVEKLG